MGLGGKIRLGKDPRGTSLHMGGGLLYHSLDLGIAKDRLVGPQKLIWENEVDFLENILVFHN